MPAWSIPGSQRVLNPIIRFIRIKISTAVFSSAWPRWSEPVMFGGAIITENFLVLFPGRLSGLKKPDFSQSLYILSSTSLGLY